MKGRIYLSVLILTLSVYMQSCARKPSDFERAVAALKDGNFDNGVLLLTAESDNGNREAKNILAKLYASGLGVNRDSNRAERLLGCEGDSSCVSGKAEFFLAMDFLDGAGIEQDSEQARYWLQKSAERGYSAATEKLNEMSHGAR